MLLRKLIIRVISSGQNAQKKPTRQKGLNDMAMSRPARPAILVYGVVTVVSPRRAYDRDAKRYTDEVIGWELTVAQENGSTLLVRFDEDAVVPKVHDKVAIYAEVNESREYGVTLSFQRNVIPDDLDRINSSLAVAAKG